jgi:hypothetical protein
MERVDDVWMSGMDVWTLESANSTGELVGGVGNKIDSPDRLAATPVCCAIIDGGRGENDAQLCRPGLCFGGGGVSCDGGHP